MPKGLKKLPTFVKLKTYIPRFVILGEDDGRALVIAGDGSRIPHIDDGQKSIVFQNGRNKCGTGEGSFPRIQTSNFIVQFVNLFYDGFLNNLEGFLFSLNDAAPSGWDSIKDSASNIF